MLKERKTKAAKIDTPGITNEFTDKYVDNDKYFETLMGILNSFFLILKIIERSLGVQYKSKVNKTCPWNNIELKFRDGMKSLYT